MHITLDPRRRRRDRRRIIALVASLALLPASMVTASSAPPTAPETPAGPTIVLVHGAFADASSWNGVIAA